MNLEPYVAVSGESGLFKLVASRNNGLILENLDTGKSKFYSVRKHQFTPLGTVAIYTLTDTSSLTEVFQTMLDKYEDLPPVSPKSETHEIEEYFEQILPEYDEDKVSVKDMKKVIKWFTSLKEKNLLIADEEE
jgi:hypothetical protein